MGVPRSTQTLDIVFEAPLFQSERQSDRVAADWRRMRSQITSTTQLEIAYRAVEPEISALNLQLSETDAKDALDLYNKTVIDGRYVNDLMTKPSEVAERLNAQVSEAAIEAITRAGSIRILQTDEQGWSQILILAIVVVIAFGPHVASGQAEAGGKALVIDSSGLIKF